MASVKTFQLIATKLALSDSEKVISKAAEYERLLQSKSVAGSNMTDTAKVVICLDLAAYFYGVELDVKMAVKYSGLKGPSYAATRKMVENLVEHCTEKLVIPSLCLALQCPTVQGLAEKILQEYINHSKMEIDLNMPQYVCVAVYHACRLNKVKVSKSKLLEKSRLKPAQWAKLVADWTTFVDEHFASSAPKKRGRPKKQVVVEEDENLMEVEESKKEEDQQIEPYEDWKTRMLEQAYRELKEVLTAPRQRKESLSAKVNTPKIKDFDSPMLTKISPRKEQIVLKYDNQGSPRRSPRKTPQKFSPYKNSPSKAQGVRLLFPL